MGRILVGVAMFVAMGAADVMAQQGQGQGLRNREGLRRQVMERFVENFARQAGLDESQRGQFEHELQGEFAEQQQLGERRREVIEGLEAEMRPGVAANENRVRDLMEEWLSMEEERAAGLRQQQERLGAFLSPTQRALFVIHFTRFQRQIEMMLQRRQGRPEGAGRMPMDFLDSKPDGLPDFDPIRPTGAN